MPIGLALARGRTVPLHHPRGVAGLVVTGHQTTGQGERRRDGDQPPPRPRAPRTRCSVSHLASTSGRAPVPGGSGRHPGDASFRTPLVRPAGGPDCCRWSRPGGPNGRPRMMGGPDGGSLARGTCRRGWQALPRRVRPGARSSCATGRSRSRLRASCWSGSGPAGAPHRPARRRRRPAGCTPGRSCRDTRSSARSPGVGPGVDAGWLSRRVGVAWLRTTFGACRWCRAGRENLCPRSEHTGWDADGGYAELMVTPAAYAYEIPDAFDDLHAAPLLCAGIIGYRRSGSRRSRPADGSASTASAAAHTSPRRCRCSTTSDTCSASAPSAASRPKPGPTASSR